MAERFTIIPDDKLVVLNGAARSPLSFTLDPTIHAVQGYVDGRIVIEYKPVQFRDQMLQPLNETTRDITPFEPALAAWANYVPPKVEEQPA